MFCDMSVRTCGKQISNVCCCYRGMLCLGSVRCGGQVLGVASDGASDGEFDGRQYRCGASDRVDECTQLRPERLHFHSRHAAERDPGDSGFHCNPTGVPNQFGTQRYALLFELGTYGSSDHPLNFQVGYCTMVAGLGLSPNDVVINGSIYVRNQCFGANNCIALVNFWRSLSNLTINVITPGFGCYFGEFWAVSQAAPMRRVRVNGFATLMDYCMGPSFASGGFITSGSGGILNVVNNTGGSSTAANPDTPVTVVSYP